MLMLSGLASNQILYMLHMTQPLEFWGIFGMWNAVTLLLIAIGFWRNRQPVELRLKRFSAIPKLAWLLVGLSLVLSVLAIFGAIRLNNGGDGLVAELALAYACGLIIYTFFMRRKLPDGTLAWFIFMLSLTILLMSSLRGWDIVGHDIEREFRVYTLTHLSGRWDIGLDRDPYNACLSITILPEMFARMINISGLAVFKVILQIIFAICPVVLFTLLRRYTSKLGALVGCLLFICYPTFINDSAMLTRQGVAYLFFALALLLMANKTQPLRHKLLFLLCALGAILSHYSTAYMFVSLFAIAAICKMVLTAWRLRHGPKIRPPRTVLSLIFASLLFFMTFMWYSQITATSSGLVVTVQKSLANIPKLFSDDNKSSDTSTALLFAGGQTQAGLYQSYLLNPQLGKVTDLANAAPFLPNLTSDNLPLTALGKKALTVGINPEIISTLRQNFAKVLQVLAVAGVALAIYGLLRKKSYAVGTDFTSLSLAGIFLLALMVALPILSLNYGILRAFQQALIFLLLPITILLIKFGRRLWPWLCVTIATAGTLFLFLLFTGVFAQMLGGSSPSMAMNNTGLYYGLFYSSQADAQAFTWLKNHVAKGNDVRAANFNKAFMHDPDYPFNRSGILPTQITIHSYVYLDPAQVVANRFYTYYQSSPLIMTFPLDYYDAAKNQVYSTATTRIYQ